MAFGGKGMDWWDWWTDGLVSPLRLDAEEILRLAKAFTHREVLDGERIVSQGVVQMVPAPVVVSIAGLVQGT